jgi:hypothetical protein
MSEYLKPCWKCGKQPIYVRVDGWINLDERLNNVPSNFVSCVQSCMPMTEKYTVDEWQNHPRGEPSAMSELAGTKYSPKFVIKLSATAISKGIKYTKEAIKEADECNKAFTRFNNKVAYPKKKSWLQKIRGYDHVVSEWLSWMKRYNDMFERVQSAEVMRDHYKQVFDESMKSLGRQSSIISEKSHELQLMSTVADVWQERLICVQKDYIDATETIGRRLKFSVGTYQITIIIGNPVTACYFKYPNLVEGYDETFLVVSICHKNDIFNWKRGVIEALENMVKNWLGSAYGDQVEYFNALFTAYPELGIQPVEPKKPIKKSKKLK